VIGMEQNEPALLTLTEAAAYLRVHRRTMTRLLQERQVPGVKIGRQWRVRKADLDAYVTPAVSTMARLDALDRSAVAQADGEPAR
jgi:excisionase family DNA binding protein